MGYVLVQVPNTMSFVAFVALGRFITGSAGVGVRLIATATIVSGIAAPLTSRVLDRHGVARGVRASCLASAALLAMTALMVADRVGNLGVLMVLAAGYGLASSAIIGGYRALLRFVVRDDQLPRASALEPALTQIAFIAGPAVASVTAGAAGAPSLLILMTGCLVCSAVLTFGTHASFRPTGERADSSIGGGEQIWRSLPVRTAYGLTLAIAIAAGMTQAALPVRLETAQQRAELLGFLIATQAVGAALASITLGRRIISVDSPYLYLMGLLAIAGVSAATLAYAHSSTALVATMFVLGMPLGLLYAADMMILQASVARRRQSEGFATLLALNVLGVGVGQAFGGTVLDLTSSSVTFIAASAVFAATAMLPYLSSRLGFLGGPIWVGESGV
jgi:MFS family permease